MPYVLKRTDQGGGYVADPRRNHGSYTKALQHAKTFSTREAAEQDRCPGNEIILSVEDAMGDA